MRAQRQTARILPQYRIGLIFIMLCVLLLKGGPQQGPEMEELDYEQYEEGHHYQPVVSPSKRGRKKV